MVGDYLNKYTYTYLLKAALERVPDVVDKREGSIIFDALAPACYELAGYYEELKRILLHTYASTSTGEYLNLRAAEQGLSRYEATYAVKKAIFKQKDNTPVSVPIGSRFSTITTNSPVNYIVIEPYKQDSAVIPGAYNLQCEVKGILGNSYIGPLIPLTYLQRLDIATMSDLIIPARDQETDEELRYRYFEIVNQKPFGGNVIQYIQELKAIDGVGEVQVYPVWNGGGTVKCSIIDASYNEVLTDFINLVQTMVDPDNNPELQGAGLGIAPIGHKVTVVTPSILTVNIITTVTMLTGYTISQLDPLIKEVIESYLLELRKNWGTANSMNQYELSIYIAKINAAILSVKGVANVTNTTINGSTNDLILNENATTQQLPKLGTVIFN
jgi:uncharacterized phage protein gp47/JayE